MALRPKSFSLLAAALAFACAVSRGADLAETSPFLPTSGGGGAAGASGPATPVELRGISTMGGIVTCCIFDTAKKTGAWVAVNEPGNDFVVRSVDAEAESATVFYHGQVMKLSLHESKVASAGSGPAAGRGSAPLVAPAGTTPADEQKRLDAVAAEVRRRRQEREKAFQSGGTQVAPAPPPGASLPPPGPNR